MKCRVISLCGLSALLLSIHASATAGEAYWPQWRGPNRDGISRETGLLTEWPAGGPALAWKATDIGRGFSSVSIANGRIYTMGDIDDSSYVIALNLDDGKKLWQAKVGKPGDPGGFPGTRCTPTVDGKLIFGLGQFGDLVCVNADSGEVLWHKNLKKDFGGEMMSGWGYSESPLVDGDHVMCTPGGSGGTVIALNKKTGDLVWRSTELKDPAAYCSLVKANFYGIEQYVQLTGKSVAGIAARDGSLVWRADRRGRTAVIATPVVADNSVYVTSDYGVGCNLFKVMRSTGDLEAQEVYANKVMKNHHGGVILYEGYIYGYSGNWVCQDFKSGEAKWESGKLGKGSLVYADGHFYLRSEGGKGTVALIEATPDGYQEKGRFDQPDRSNQNSWPHPVVAGGKLYLRDQNILLCYDVAKK